MPAYFIAVRRATRDQAELKAYKETAGASFEGVDFKVLVHSEAKLRLLSGEPTEGLGVIEFPTYADAEAWFDSAKFEAPWKHLLAASDVDAFIVEG